MQDEVIEATMNETQPINEKTKAEDGDSKEFNEQYQTFNEDEAYHPVGKWGYQMSNEDEEVGKWGYYDSY